MVPVTVEASKRMKRNPALDGPSLSRAKRRRVTDLDDGDSSESRIGELELEASETPPNLEALRKLISLFRLDDPDHDSNIQISISLCRAFTRLLVNKIFWPDGQTIDRHQGRDISESVAEANRDYRHALRQLVKKGNSATRSVVLRICMRILKEEDAHSQGSPLASRDFGDLVLAVVRANDGSSLRGTFAQEYLQQYHDCCYYSLRAIQCVYIILVDYFNSNPCPGRTS